MFIRVFNAKKRVFNAKKKLYVCGIKKFLHVLAL